MYKPNGTLVISDDSIQSNTQHVRCNTNHTQHQKSVNKSKRNTRGEKTATQVSKAASGHYKATIHINCKTQLPRFRIYLSIDASNTQHRHAAAYIELLYVFRYRKTTHATLKV